MSRTARAENRKLYDVCVEIASTPRSAKRWRLGETVMLHVDDHSTALGAISAVSGFLKDHERQRVHRVTVQECPGDDEACWYRRAKG